MPKKAMTATTKNQKVPYGWLFVIIWPIAASFLINGSPLSEPIARLDITTAAWTVAVIVLAPIAAVLLPLLYRMNNNQDREAPIPTWKRVAFSIIVTGMLLWVLGYFYLLLSFVFAGNFD